MGLQPTKSDETRQRGHSRVSGNPVLSWIEVDSRLRGNDLCAASFDGVRYAKNGGPEATANIPLTFNGLGCLGGGFLAKNEWNDARQRPPQVVRIAKSAAPDGYAAWGPAPRRKSYKNRSWNVLENE